MSETIYMFEYEYFVDILGAITKLDHIWMSFLCILVSFLKVKVQNGDFRGVAKISNILGVLGIPDIFCGGERKMLENEDLKRVPHWVLNF